MPTIVNNKPIIGQEMLRIAAHRPMLATKPNKAIATATRLWLFENFLLTETKIHQRALSLTIKPAGDWNRR